MRRRRCQDVDDDSVDMQQRTDTACSMQSDAERLQSASSSSNMFNYSAEVIGMVETVYRFQSKLFMMLVI